MTPLHEKLLGLIGSSWAAQAVHVAASLNIAEALQSGPATCAELAGKLDVHEDSLRRLLRALATIDISRELPGDRFELSPLGDLLRADHPASLRSWAIWWGTRLWQDWGGLLYSVKTGQSARALATGTEGFGHLRQDAEAAAVFHQAMVELTRLSAGQLVRQYDFATARTVVDVGGGSGEFVLTILEACPHMRGTILDQAHARQHAQHAIQQRGLTDRCRFSEGDFFSQIPAGADVYVLKSIIHDWDDEKSIVILRRCREAMERHSRLLLVERLVPQRLDATSEHQDSVRSDLTMLVALGARERTAEQLHGLLRAAGLAPARSLSLGGGLSLTEAIPDEDV